MRYTITTLIMLIFAAASFAGAEAEDMTLEVTPGKYEIKKETSTNLKPEPMTRTEETCITESKFDPQAALPDRENCSVSNMKKKGNNVTFDIDCKGGTQMLPMRGTAEYGTTQTTLSWKLNMKGMMEDQEVTVNSKGSGKRIGDCD
ncbi:MAG: DUF3617 family protein [Deltaproteobacteria bacterium]